MLVWRSFYRDRVRHGLVYAYMVWIWRFVFSTAVFDHLRVSAKPGEAISWSPAQAGIIPTAAIFSSEPKGREPAV